MTNEVESGQERFRSRYVLLVLGLLLIAAFCTVAVCREMISYDHPVSAASFAEHFIDTPGYVPFVVIALGTVLAVLLLREEQIRRFALPACLILTVATACLTVASSNFFHYHGVAIVAGMLSFYPAVTGELTASYTARSLSESEGVKKRYLLAFLLSVAVPLVYCVLSDRYSFICCLVAAFALLTLRASRDGALPVGRKFLIAAFALVAACFIIGAVCSPGLRERLALAFNRGRGDPNGVGFFRVIMDQIYGSSGFLRGADFNVVYQSEGAIPVWRYLLLADPSLLPVSVLAKYGYAVYAAFTLAALLPPVLLLRFSRGAATPFARYFAYYVFALFLAKVLLNAASCLLFDFYFPLPMLGSRTTVFFDAELFLTAMLLCVKKR